MFICFKKSLKIILYSILLTVLLFTGKPVFHCMAVENEDADRIVAIVNDDIIILSELNRLLIPYEQQIRSMGYTFEKEKETLFQVRENLLNQLIDEKLSDQEIQRKEITLEEKEIDATIEQIKKQSYFTDEDLRKALAREGLTMQTYREQIKDELLRSKLISYEVRSKIVVTTEDIRSYYDSHPENYGSKTKYHLKHIMMKIPVVANTELKNEIKLKMEEIIQRLKKGASFEEMAKRYSESTIADEGGYLGDFELDSLSPQIKAEIITLKPGEYTPILETDQGFQIFMLQNIIEGPKQSLDDVFDEIQNVLYNEIGNQKYQSWIEALRKQAHIQIIR